jgi:hypothetical protein
MEVQIFADLLGRMKDPDRVLLLGMSERTARRERIA